jgi:hypothetical protein
VAIASGSNSAPEDRFLDHVRLCYPAPPELLTEAAIRLEDAWRNLRGTPAPPRAPVVLGA